MTATKKEQAAKFTLAARLQALVKKQVLGRVPTNQAINAIVKFLPDPVVKDTTASLNAVKANASKEYNKLVIDTDKAIASAENKTKLAVENADKALENSVKAMEDAVEKAIENADKAFDVYMEKVLAIVKGTEFEKKIQGIK